MPYEQFKYRIISGIFDIAGNLISSQITKTNYDKDEKIQDEYYEQMKKVARENEKKQKRLREQYEWEQEHREQGEKDLTPNKIQKGTACLPCSRDHFSTVSGALSEAIRFSRKTGVQNKEVQRRLGLCLDELNMLERIDLSPEEMIQLAGEEKKLAQWGLNKSRELRHKITQIKNHDELENVAAEAATIRTEFMRNLWNIATVDGSINKLCKGLKDEEYQRCVNTINEILNEKNDSPP